MTNPFLLVLVSHKDGRLEKNGHNPTMTIFRMAIEGFLVAWKRGAYGIFFEDLSTILDVKTYDNPPFVAFETIQSPSKK
jgi:hypothetical protein